MKEIGGYFGLEQLIDSAYYQDLIALNTARNALLYLLRAKKVKKVSIPYYLCDSIRNTLAQNHYQVQYYSIDSRFRPIFDRQLDDHEYLFVVNYYGQLSQDTLLSWKENYNNMILDNTQTFFQRPITGIDTIYSCRKYFGVPDGAYLATNSKLKENLKTDVSRDRMTHILGRFEGLASDHYAAFKRNEKSLQDEPVKYMSKLTRNLLGAIDYDRVRKTRDRNFSYLDRKLKKINRLAWHKPVGPFAYPFYIENGRTIRKKLAEKQIYIPVLWPNILNECTKDSIEYEFAANLLPLPCDQRYGLTEMAYLNDTLIDIINQTRK